MRPVSSSRKRTSMFSLSGERDARSRTARTHSSSNWSRSCLNDSGISGSAIGCSFLYPVRGGTNTGCEAGSGCRVRAQSGGMSRTRVRLAYESSSTYDVASSELDLIATGCRSTHCVLFCWLLARFRSA